MSVYISQCGEDEAEGRVYEYDAQSLLNSLTQMGDCVFSVHKTGNDFKSGDKIELYEPVRMTFTVIGPGEDPMPQLRYGGIHIISFPLGKR